MNNTNVIKAALLGSASALGLNWIYDRRLLRLHKEAGHPMIFEPIDHELYKSAKKGYDVYPGHRVGDLDFMGEVLYLFYMFMTFEKDRSLEHWRSYFYEYFRPDYEYKGWIESYGKAFLERYNQPLEASSDEDYHTDYVDKQLIGPLFLLATYRSPNSSRNVADATTYVKTLTAYDGVEALNNLFYRLLSNLETGMDKAEALSLAVLEAPEEYRAALAASLTDMAVDKFILNHSGVACDLEQALPLIFYIVAHSDTWEEALVTNATLGGASSARGIFISALMSRFTEIPETYRSLLNYHVE